MFVRVNVEIDGGKHKAILKEHLLQGGKDFEACWRFTFKQDNDSKDSARGKMQRFGSQHVYVLKRPHQNPDLNLIENT